MLLFAKKQTNAGDRMAVLPEQMKEPGFEYDRSSLIGYRMAEEFDFTVCVQEHRSGYQLWRRA